MAVLPQFLQLGLLRRQSLYGKQYAMRYLIRMVIASKLTVNGFDQVVVVLFRLPIWYRPLERAKNVLPGE